MSLHYLVKRLAPLWLTTANGPFLWHSVFSMIHAGHMFSNLLLFFTYIRLAEQAITYHGHDWTSPTVESRQLLLWPMVVHSMHVKPSQPTWPIYLAAQFEHCTNGIHSIANYTQLTISEIVNYLGQVTTEVKWDNCRFVARETMFVNKQMYAGNPFFRYYFDRH